MSERMTEYPDRRVWDLNGFTLEQIRLGYQINLIFYTSQSSLSIDIETPFTLRRDGDTIGIVPEQVMSTVPILPLLHQPIVSLTAFRDQTLLLRFGDGSEIEVPLDEKYESWNSGGTGEVAGIGMLASGHPGSPWGE